MSNCLRCDEERRLALKDAGDWVGYLSRRMILCPDCGNKRCPKASDHRLDCTGSNEPNQRGSWYRGPAA